MKEVISFVSQYEAHFRVEMEQKLRLQSEETIKVYKKRLAQAEKRIGELDRLFIKIYEDNAKGNLSDERFAMMSKTYEDEQAQLKVEIVNLQKEVEVQERQIENLEQFIQRVRRYTTLTELTPYALRELVKAVYVEAPDKSSGKRKQKVHIEYDLVGYIPVDELIKAEQAWPKSCLFQEIHILLFYDHRALERGVFCAAHDFFYKNLAIILSDIDKVC